MTKTKNQLTVTEKVKAESVYQRACAQWLVDKNQKDNMDVYKTYGVDFWFESIEGCPTCGPEEYSGLKYYYNGTYKEVDLDLRYSITPGQFLEECVTILHDPRFIPYPE